MPVSDPITITFTPFPDHETVEAFYDRALCAALSGLLAFGCTGRPDLAEIEARDLTERRFGVNLVLPGDGE